ncbi:MAG: helix-turn-helix domain-containing protein [Planctomycetota bacterium]|jgi:transcriptional regulator with XRE-family HTH domain
MKAVREVRHRRGYSQRELARIAGVSFRAIQLLETHHHDPRLSTVEKVCDALGLPPAGVRWAIDRYLADEADSAFHASVRMYLGGVESWMVHLFDFVDRFRADPAPSRVRTPPAHELDPRLAALLASTVDTLCDDQGWRAPDWTAAVGSLPQPWFVSGVENLKASALLESPVQFRRRNIFVLENFLARA